MVLEFKKDVPLESFSAVLTAPDGTRTDLTGAIGSDSTQVVVQMPAITDGNWSLRWKLVGADGHAVTDTVDFSLALPPGSTTTIAQSGGQVGSPSGSTAGAAASGTTGSSTTGSNGQTAEPATTTVPKLAAPSPTATQTDSFFQTPAPLRWLVRVIGFTSFFALVGALVVALRLWPDRWSDYTLQRTAGLAIVALTASSILNLAFALADISGNPPWAVLDDFWEATGFGIVKGTSLRILVCAFLGLFVLPVTRLLRGQAERPDPMGASFSLGTLAMSFSVAGHPWALPAPLIGVPIDMIHLTAAAIWVGSMIFLGPLGGSQHRSELPAWRDAVMEFAKIAQLSVIAIVITGTIQTLRIDGLGGGLFGSTHGRIILTKAVFMGALLWAANINRKRISRRLRAQDAISSGIARALRRAMATEFAVGATVIALTAALVTSAAGAD